MDNQVNTLTKLAQATLADDGRGTQYARNRRARRLLVRALLMLGETVRVERHGVTYEAALTDGGKLTWRAASVASA